MESPSTDIGTGIDGSANEALSVGNLSLGLISLLTRGDPTAGLPSEYSREGDV